MSHRNEERDDYRNSSRHNRQDIQSKTTQRTQPLPSSISNMDRHFSAGGHSRSDGY
ncbi:unnamed protein product, partial [Rotaria socialis]